MEDKKKRNVVLRTLTSPTTIVSLVGTGFGLGEAILYANLEANKGKSLKEFKLNVPTGKELVKTMSVVVVTSVLTGIMTDLILKALLPEEQYFALHPELKDKKKSNKA